MNTVFILGETINGENPTNSSEIESAPKVKPKNIKMISTASNSLSHIERASPLSLVHPNELLSSQELV